MHTFFFILHVASHIHLFVNEFLLKIGKTHDLIKVWLHFLTLYVPYIFRSKFRGLCYIVLLSKTNTLNMQSSIFVHKNVRKITN